MNDFVFVVRGAMLDEVEAPKRFKLLRRIGEGGMGVVHEALDTERGERVALKTLRHTNAEALVRFKREFRALQDLHHPNLVSLGELVSEGESWCFTMELVKGEDFVSWVTPAVFAGWTSAKMRIDPDAPPSTRRAPEPANAFAFDEGRLRAALVQLARGLVALHDAGKVHRDVKPSNVLVTREGRVVLLDFGLVTDLHGDPLAMTATDLDVVGTPAYMAPEQAASKAVGPAADWYAVGVLLYEAMTGQLPFSGAPLEVLLRKQKDEPPPPSAIAEGVPADLDALCAQMLRFDPAARPTGRHVLRALRAAPNDRGSHASIGTVTSHALFVGRDAELEALARAFEATRSGKPVSVLVHGESGIGKSCLVKHFTDVRAAQERELVVLAGRCYEREAVPYKAFDGVIDALSRFMAHAPATEATHLLPTRPASLVQVFPVLRRVEAIAQASRGQVANADPHELRSRAFAATRELFVRLADRRPLIVVIDDVQWADADSVALLAELLRPPDAPALLLIATIRDASPDGTEAARPAIDVARAIPGDVRHVHIDRLTSAQARDLAATLVERAAPALHVNAEAIAREADGHPLFIDEIVRHVCLVGAPAAGALSLDDALWSRIRALDEAPRRLVELVAVAGAPIAQEIASKALGVTGAEFSKVTSFLRVAHLVRTTGARGTDPIEPYHGRIRDAVLAKLDAETRRMHHERLALAMETSGSADSEALATHWQGAGDLDAAAKHMVAAADHANQALAFDRAAQLYQRTLTLRARGAHRSTRDEERALEVKLADALAKAGRGALAATVYRSAARGASASEALDLERRAAEQLLRTGHFDEGLAASKAVLASVHLRLPDSPIYVIVALVFWRVVLRVRGLGFRPRDPSEVPVHVLTRIDIIWSIAFALSLVDVMRGQLFQTKNILSSLRVGEPYRAARSLGIEVSYSGTEGGRSWKRTRRLMEKAQHVARETGHPHAIGWSLAGTAVAYYLAGRFQRSREVCAEAETIFRDETSGSGWEVATMQLFGLKSLANLGDTKELCRRAPAALREALDRGDVWAAVNMRIGHPNFHHLVHGRVDDARRDLDEAMEQWSKQGFHLEHYYELYARTNADLYAGDAAQAYARVTGRWGALRGSLLMHVQMVLLYALHMRARTAIALAERDEPRRRDLLRAALRDARAIEREKMAWSNALATLVRAGAASVAGDRASSMALLARAAEVADEARMALHAAAARRVLGALEGGDAGRARHDAAEAWMREGMITDPNRITAVLAPGFARI